MLSENKNTVLFRIYQVLFDYSDEKHPLTQQQIIDKLNADYGIELERKAVGRNLSFLRDMGFEIHSDRNGSYLEDRPLENSELRLLIDGVLSSRHISAKYSKDLIEKLIFLGGVNFKPHVRHIYSVNDWGKYEGKELFLNIDLIDEAIEGSRKITFIYNKFGADKKLHGTSRNTVSPYQMILHNQRYYLMGFNDKWQGVRFYRIDRITEVKLTDEPSVPISQVEGYENGINYSAIANERPYMYTDKPERITLKCHSGLIDQVIDWFGFDITVEENDGEYATVKVKSSPSAMMYWALQYGDGVEVIAPENLRSRIKDMLKTISQKYE